RSIYEFCKIPPDRTDFARNLRSGCWFDLRLGGSLMPKNVVLCCDGTANEFAQDRTNVVKLFFSLVSDPALQIAYYHPVLGTIDPPGALIRATRIATRLAGRAFGYGLEADI